MRGEEQPFPFLARQSPWAENHQPIWIASTLLLHRNFTQLFPSKLDRDTKQLLAQKLDQALRALPGLSHPSSLSAEESLPFQKELIYEHFLSPEGFQQARSGERFLFDSSGAQLFLLNIEDHLQIQLTEINQQLEEAYQRVIHYEALIGKEFPYAYSNRFGFLTANPLHCGTGFELRLFLHLPALIHQGLLPETREALAEKESLLESLAGGGEHVAGDLLILRNRCTIGLTEAEILQRLRSEALKLIVLEKRLRKELHTTPSLEMKDRVSRAYGLAMHSYQLELPEAWDAISLMKLGIDVGWIEGADHALLNELLMGVRRAHLFAEYSEEVSQDQLPGRRADFLHSHLRSLRLSI